MAKRSRIGGRPGQRRPMQRTPARPTAARPSRPAGSVTPEEEARAAEEYAYVRRDVRRIAVVGGSLLGVLAILHILVNVANVI